MNARTSKTKIVLGLKTITVNGKTYPLSAKSQEFVKKLGREIATKMANEIIIGK